MIKAYMLYLKKFVFILLLLVFSLSGYGNNKDTLIVGYKIAPPFVVEKNSKLMGPSVWLWEHIAEEIKIPYVFKKYSLDSLLNGLESGKIDVALSPLTITSERSKVIDFSSPYYIAHSSILQKDISPLSKTLAFIGSFFSINFFRALGALTFVILVFGILVWIFERKRNKDQFDKGFKGLWNGFWWSAVTMTTVGYGDKTPKSIGGRIVGLIWMYTSIIIISGFTASIASALTVNRIGSSNVQIRDFKEKTLGTIKNSSTEAWLKNNFFNDKKVYSEMDMLIKALEIDHVEGIAYDRPILQNILNNDTLSRFSLLNIKYNPQFYAIGMNKNLSDSIKDVINLTMLDKTEIMDWRVLLAEYNLN